MKKKMMAVAVAGVLLLSACGTQDIKPDKDPSAEVNKPKPVSTVFNRPVGPTTIEFTPTGEFVSITAKGVAPIAGNNAYSVEQAVTAATLRAKRNLAEFIATDMQTQRTVNVLSHTVQRSKENTLNGMIDTPLVIDDSIFDLNGNPEVNAAENGEVYTGENGGVYANPLSGYPGEPNTNSQKIAETVKENVLAKTQLILKGVYVVSEKVVPEGRVVIVEVRSSANTINAANEIRKVMMEN